VGLYALGTFVVILPFLLFRFPLCTDYLPHLAWIRVLLSPVGSPLRRVFDVRWALIPNLGLPLFAVSFGEFLTPEEIVKSYNLLGIIGVAGGVLWLNHSIRGRIQPTILLALPMLHSWVVTAGLYDFTFGTAIALFILAAVQDASMVRRALILNVFAPLLFFIHLGALICLGLTIFLLDCERARPVWRALLTAPLCFLTTLPFYVIETKPLSTHATVFSNLPTKLITILGVFDSGNIVLALGCALLFSTLAIVLYQRGASFAPRWNLAVAGLWLAGMIAPTILQISGGVDARIFWYAALISITALQVPAIEERHWGSGIIGLVTLILSVRLCTAISAFTSFNRDVAELTQAVTIIPSGAPIFVALPPDPQETTKGELARGGPRDARFYWHISSVAPLTGHGLDTMFFAQRGSVIIEPKPALTHYIADQPVIPPAAPVAVYLFNHDASSSLIQMLGRGNMADLLDYSLNWGQRFPYLLYLDLGYADDPFASKLQLVGCGSFFKIYRNPAVDTDLFRGNRH
jgi:hypothetical protein